jgi:hypothetical protein
VDATLRKHASTIQAVRAFIAWVAIARDRSEYMCDIENMKLAVANNMMTRHMLCEYTMRRIDNYVNDLQSSGNGSLLPPDPPENVSQFLSSTITVES